MYKVILFCRSKLTISLVLLAITLTGCLRRVVSVEEVDKMVKDQLPIGADQQQVRTFIDNLKIGSLNIERYDLHKASRETLGNLDLEKTEALGDRIAMYTGASIKDARSGFLTHDNIQIIFYLDKDGKMIGYSVKEWGSE